MTSKWWPGAMFGGGLSPVNCVRDCVPHVAKLGGSVKSLSSEA